VQYDVQQCTPSRGAFGHELKRCLTGHSSSRENKDHTSNDIYRFLKIIFSPTKCKSFKSVNRRRANLPSTDMFANNKTPMFTVSTPAIPAANYGVHRAGLSSWLRSPLGRIKLCSFQGSGIAVRRFWSL